MRARTSCSRFGYAAIKSEVRSALSDSITRILTPNTSTDVLLSIRTKLAAINGATSSKRNPYSMTFVGVNGVGKSTNLSKVCFWLIQNNLRVLIAACDTFRSGAVEQLRVHTRNLSLLAEQTQMGAGGVELYERGYGKDAAGIAKEAIAYGQSTRRFSKSYFPCLTYSLVYSQRKWVRRSPHRYGRKDAG